MLYFFVTVNNRFYLVYIIKEQKGEFMKKFLLILLSLISVICIAFAFGGCNKTIKITGTFYTMEKAYEKGYLSEDDLKSIACSYYDSHNFRYEENPYSGMFTSTEKLTKKLETEIKQAYLEEIVKVRDGDRDRVDINRYYGTYNENIVIRIYCSYLYFDHAVEPEAEVGGVMFKDYWVGDFLVYHIYK